jgi:hypothetical protein
MRCFWLAFAMRWTRSDVTFGRASGVPSRPQSRADSSKRVEISTCASQSSYSLVPHPLSPMRLRWVLGLAIAHMMSVARASDSPAPRPRRLHNHRARGDIAITIRHPASTACSSYPAPGNRSTTGPCLRNGLEDRRREAPHHSMQGYRTTVHAFRCPGSSAPATPSLRAGRCRRAQSGKLVACR